MGLVLAGGLLLGLAGESEAQFSLSIGNPYTGQGFSVGAPAYGYGNGYGYGSGYGNGYGYSNYGNGYSNYGNGYSGYGNGYSGYGNGYGVSNNYYSSGYAAAPVVTTYSSGYGVANNTYYNQGYVAAPVVTTYSSGYAGYAPTNPATGYQTLNRYYGAYGYGNYGYGSRDGFRPFRGAGRLFR